MRALFDAFGRRKRLFITMLAVIFAAGLAGAGDKSGSWKQFGGPHQDFQAPSSGLAKEWAPEGPRQIWSRELGEGYSAIVVDDGRLYTMHRDGDREAVICMSARTGETLWEHKYESSPREGHEHRFGDGPRSTPLIDADRIYAIGVSGKMHALDKKTGKVAWTHDLWGEFDGNFLMHGYASSPIAYRNTIITLVGGEDASIVAFNKKDGSVAWKSLSYKNSYSTPRILNIGGEEQLVTFMATELIGIDPGNGKLKWEYSHENQWKQNISMPKLVADGNHLFLSSPMAGARGLKLKPDGDKTEVEEVWSSRKIQFYHVSTVRDGEWVYGSTGTFAPAFLAAVNIKTGEIAWRKRGFAKANCLAADGRIIILDEDGNLALATATPEDLIVHSRVELLDKVAWTVPTVVGRTLFVRDKQTIMALDLS